MRLHSLEKVARLRAAGHRAEAEVACRALVASNPGNPDALWLLGALCHESDRVSEARVMLGRAVSAAEAAGLAPPLEWRLTLGSVQQQCGELRQALETFTVAASEHPGSGDAHFCRATAFQSLDRAEEAIAEYRLALDLDPDNAPAANNLGIMLRDRGRLAAAEHAFRRALRARPGFGDAQANYGSLLQKAGRFAQAHRYLLSAAAAAPDDLELQRVLAQNEIYIGDVPAAAGRLEKALRRGGDDPSMLSQLASVRLFQGRQAAAVELCERALALNRSCAAAHYYLAGAQHEFEDSSRMEEIRRALKAPGITERDRALLFFAGGDRLGAVGSYGEAFSWYRRGNDVRARMLAAQGMQYDPAQHDARVDRTIASFGPTAFAGGDRGSDSHQPVFIIGMPRSGTSLVEQILSSHGDIAGGGELALVGDEVARLSVSAGYPERRPDGAALKQFAARYIGRLSHVGAGKRYVTDKKPTNFLHLGLIALAFPNARVIHCRRDRRDIGLSCYFQNFTGPGLAFSYDLGNLAHFHDAYLRIMAHWREVLPLSIAEVDYETLVADHETETHRLLTFLECDWDPACLDFHRNRRPVVTASHTQVRRPIYAGSVGRWRNYASEMGFVPGR
jgi:tetratricopeptide (TPR) repeat protein